MKEQVRIVHRIIDQISLMNEDIWNREVKLNEE